MMVPLRCTWELCTPISGMAMPLHLDALLARAVTEEARCLGSVAANDEPPFWERLPLEKATSEESQEAWCWKASALISQGNREHSMCLWTRHTDVYDFGRRASQGQFKNVQMKAAERPFGGIIDTARGDMRNHYQFIPTRAIQRFVAYCIGDEDRVLELLHPDAGYITNLGARHNSGYGKIRLGGFSMERDDKALELWQKRIMPWQIPGTKPIQAPHRAPYDAKTRLVTSFVEESIFC